jgi:hypothetical protein
MAPDNALTAAYPAGAEVIATLADEWVGKAAELADSGPVDPRAAGRNGWNLTKKAEPCGPPSSFLRSGLADIVSLLAPLAVLVTGPILLAAAWSGHLRHLMLLFCDLVTSSHNRSGKPQTYDSQ